MGHDKADNDLWMNNLHQSFIINRKLYPVQEDVALTGVSEDIVVPSQMMMMIIIIYGSLNQPPVTTGEVEGVSEY